MIKVCLENKEHSDTGFDVDLERAEMTSHDGCPLGFPDNEVGSETQSLLK